MTAAPLLEVHDLTIVLGGPSQRLEAVSRVNFSLAEGRTLGIVGESGCGKSITMLALMGLLPGHVEITGSVRFRGEELLGKPQHELSRLRGKRMAMIFQDPMTSLNPVMSVAEQIEEAISIHDGGMSRAARHDRALALLKTVAIPFPERRLRQYPHELSGGMRQRVMIAIAMANDPDLLIADEPTTALDVTVQAQIIELLQQLQAERKMGLVLISHDLGVVAGVAHDVAIMYAGRICERGPVDAVFERPGHPYTSGLLASLPQIDATVASLTAIPGSLPSLAARPVGCRFHPRCALAQPVCTENDPQLLPQGAGAVACHFAGKVRAP